MKLRGGMVGWGGEKNSTTTGGKERVFKRKA